MSAPSGPVAGPLLDPRDADPAARARLLLWLAIQERLAWEPQLAARALADDPDPVTLLARVGRTPPGDRRLEAARRALVRAEAGLLPRESPAWPALVTDRLKDPPPVLAVRGAPEALAARAVAVVGARAATRYGRDVARALGRALGGAGLVVLSGLARGVDAAAHEGALEAGGRSVALLGCGVDRVYPPEHRRLAARLVEAGGAVASELPAGTPPRAPHFPLRNRLLAALAERVVVVEARLRSGSLVTARHAADQGVDVWAVPGPIDAPTSAGPNRLLYDGAWVLSRVEDLLESLGVGEASPAASARAAGASAPTSPEIRAVRQALAEGPLGRDALGRRLGLAPDALAPVLLELELAGALAEDRDGRLRLRRGASARADARSGAVSWPLRGEGSRL